MLKIHKYRLQLVDSQDLRMPADAKILKLEMQDGELCLWCEVQPQNSVQTRRFIIVGTGVDFREFNRSYLGTVFERMFVWHVYEDLS